MIKELTAQEIYACSGGREEKQLPEKKHVFNAAMAAGMSVGCGMCAFITLALAGTLETKYGKIFTAVTIPIMMVVSYNVWIGAS